MVRLAIESQKHYIPNDFMFDNWIGKISKKLLFTPMPAWFHINQTPPDLCLNFTHGVHSFTRENFRVSRIAAVHVRNLKALKGARKRKLLTSYRMLFEHSCDSSLFTDLMGNILEANTAAIKAYGYTHEELCAMKIGDLRVEDSGTLINTQMKEAYDTGITFKTYHVRKNGEHFPVEVSSHRVVDKSWEILLSIIRDISDRNRIESEFVKTENIKVIGKVAAGLAHEIRNSITSVHGFLQLASSLKIDQRKFAENCNLMLQELDRANNIISNLILVENDRKINLEIKSLNRILLTLFPEIQTIAESQDKIVEMLLEETSDIPLNENEIKELVINLVNNALDSMIQGGKVVIKTHKTKNTITLSIEDNGSGIKPEIFDQLGTPFLTTKDTGIGLGLIICKSIVIRHNATLNIESSNLGTNVQIAFNIQPTILLSQKK